MNLSKGMHCLTLFIDFSKAFDTLSHKKLLQMLEKIGIRGSTLCWFQNYLECRSYQVKIQNILSDNTAIECGVPQGSKLGPILYIIYANELLNALEKGKAFAYADDTAIIVSNLCLQSAIETMQNELDIANRWCHDNGLVINALKTKIMHIRPKHLAHTPVNLIFHNTECLHKKANNPNLTCYNCNIIIETVNVYKYLGVTVDNRFKRKEHIESLQKKLRKSAYMLCHLSYCSIYSVLRQVYFSLVESHIRHGISAWGSSVHCRLLQNSQNQLLKILQKNFRFSETSNFHNINRANNNNRNDKNIAASSSNALQISNATHNNVNNANIRDPTVHTIYNSTNTMNINLTSNIFANTTTANTKYTPRNILSTIPSTREQYNNSNTNVNNIFRTNTTYNNTHTMNNYSSTNLINNTSHNSPHNSVSTNNNSEYNSSAPSTRGSTINHLYTPNNRTQAKDSSNAEQNTQPRSTKLGNRNINLTKQLNLMNVNSIYRMTLINEFYKDNRFLNAVDHKHNTRSRAQGKLKVQRFQNEYGRSTLGVALPTIFNKIPKNIIDENNASKRKKLLKNFLISSQ